jgi:hypothetical protein
MTNQSKQVRFGVLWNNIPYEIFSLFVTKDETICLITYLKSSKIGVKNIGKVVERRAQVDVNLKEIPMYEFTAHKISFHKSGYIHSTDKKGERVSELNGRRGCPFEEIADCTTLLSIYPMIPENYRKHNSLTKVVQLVDVQKFGFVPFQVTCYLSKSDYDFAQEVIRINKGTKSLFLRCRNYVPNYSLDLFVRFHKSSSPVFPTGEVIGYFCKSSA